MIYSTVIVLFAILPVFILCHPVHPPTTAHVGETTPDDDSTFDTKILENLQSFFSAGNPFLEKRAIVQITNTLKTKITKKLPEFKAFIIPIINGTIKTLQLQGIKTVFDVLTPLVKSYRKNSSSIFHFVNNDKFQRMMALTIDQFNTAIKSKKLNTSDASEALREIFEQVDWKVIFKGYLHEFDISKILKNELVQEIVGDFIPKSVVQKYIPLVKSLFSHFDNLQPDQVMSKAMKMLADNLYNADLSELTDDFFINVKKIIGQIDWGKIVDTIIDIPDVITDKVPRIKSIAKNVIGNLKSLASRFGFGRYLSNKKSITTTATTPTPTTSAPTTPPIVFSVGSSQGFTPVTPMRVPMEIMIYNEGAHFHIDDNTFYAPVTGVYFFTFSGVSRHQSKLSLHLFTQKPGEVKVMVARAMAEGNTGKSNAAASVFVKLSKGEMVSVWSWGEGGRRYSVYGAVAPYGPTTLFSGRLEHQLPE